MFHNDKIKPLFFVALLLQLIFWNYTKNIKPEFEILPKPISPKYAKLISFGDDEFLFRSLSIRIQNAGDVYAGFTPLKFYDYQKLHDWFIFMDNLKKIIIEKKKKRIFFRIYFCNSLSLRIFVFGSEEIF